jgi:sugar fermentation stimulation protein A
VVPARFVSRPNRFVVMARLERGVEVRCHLADPGRLKELLVPGAELRLSPAAATTTRRTRWSVALVRSPSPPYPWVSLDTTVPNRLALRLLTSGRVRGVGRGWTIRPEVRRGASRFDFLLTRPGEREVLVEVKSVSLVESGRAWFPDAPTVRGARHLRELAEHVRGGGSALVLFVVQRPDARSVSAHARTDPDFAVALREARSAGVRLRGARFRFDGQGRSRFVGSIPVR